MKSFNQLKSLPISDQICLLGHIWISAGVLLVSIGRLFSLASDDRLPRDPISQRTPEFEQPGEYGPNYFNLR